MMKEDLLNIVALIVRQMSEEGLSSLHGRSILDGLMDEGYDPLEIDDALSWFESLAGAGEELGGIEHWPGFRGFRVQSPAERETLTPEAFAYIARLNKAGILEDRLRETVLDKIQELSMPAFGIDHVKALLGLVLYSRGGVSQDNVFYMLGEQEPGSADN